MRKSTLTKFSNISYPIFALKSKPAELIYTYDKILCRLKAGDTIHTVDDKRLGGDYFSRLVKLKHRIEFDFTCKNLQDLLISKARWGMDNAAIPHDFSQLYTVPAEVRKVVRVVDNLIWLKNISYPFKISTNENIRLDDGLYATIVYVNGEWYLRDFSIDKITLSRPYVLV